MAFLSVSVFLTGTMQLRATEDERRNIGGAIADALASFDESGPFIKLLNAVAPWSGVLDGLANAVYDRVLYVRDHRAGRVPSTAGAAAPRFYPTPSSAAANGRTEYDDDGLIYAPDPGAVN